MAAGMIIFLIVAAASWYFWVGAAPDELRVDSVQSQWISSDADRTTLVSTAVLRNDLEIDVQLEQVRHWLDLGGETISGEPVSRSEVIVPGGTVPVELTLHVPNAAMAKWWVEHLAADEEGAARVGGEARLVAGGKPVTVAFEAPAPWSTSLLESLSKSARNCPQSWPEPCVSATSLAWVGVGDDGRLRLEMDVRNDHTTALAISESRATLRLHDVAVAQASAPWDLRIASGARARIQMDLVPDLNQLAAWWPRHAADCEGSSASLEVSVAFRLADPEPEPSPSGPPLPSTPSTSASSSSASSSSVSPSTSNPSSSSTPTTTSSAPPSSTGTSAPPPTTSSTPPPPPTSSTPPPPTSTTPPPPSSSNPTSEPSPPPSSSEPTSPSPSPTSNGTEPAQAPQGTTGPPVPASDGRFRISSLAEGTLRWTFQGPEFRTRIACAE